MQAKPMLSYAFVYIWDGIRIRPASEYQACANICKHVQACASICMHMQAIPMRSYAFLYMWDGIRIRLASEYQAYASICKHTRACVSMCKHCKHMETNTSTCKHMQANIMPSYAFLYIWHGIRIRLASEYQAYACICKHMQAYVCMCLHCLLVYARQANPMLSYALLYIYGMGSESA